MSDVIVSQDIDRFMQAANATVALAALSGFPTTGGGVNGSITITGTTTTSVLSTQSLTATSIQIPDNSFTIAKVADLQAALNNRVKTRTVTGNTAAEIRELLIVPGSAVITDPSLPVNGDYYFVRIIPTFLGSVTVGGTNYTDGFLFRTYSSSFGGSWTTTKIALGDPIYPETGTGPHVLGSTPFLVYANTGRVLGRSAGLFRSDVGLGPSSNVFFGNLTLSGTTVTNLLSANSVTANNIYTKTQSDSRFQPIIGTTKDVRFLDQNDTITNSDIFYIGIYSQYSVVDSGITGISFMNAGADVITLQHTAPLSPTLQVSPGQIVTFDATSEEFVNVNYITSLQPWSNNLTAVAALSTTGIIRRTGATTASAGGTVALNEGGTGATTASAARVNLGLGIDNDVRFNTLTAREVVSDTNIINITANKVFNYSTDNSKIFNFNTVLGNLSAIFPSTLPNGFNIGITNTGTNTIFVSSTQVNNLCAFSNRNSTRFSGIYIYKADNTLYGIGRFN